MFLTGFELPRINYDINGKRHRFVYGNCVEHSVVSKQVRCSALCSIVCTVLALAGQPEQIPCLFCLLFTECTCTPRSVKQYQEAINTVLSICIYLTRLSCTIGVNGTPHRKVWKEQPWFKQLRIRALSHLRQTQIETQDFDLHYSGNFSHFEWLNSHKWKTGWTKGTMQNLPLRIAHIGLNLNKLYCAINYNATVFFLLVYETKTASAHHSIYKNWLSVMSKCHKGSVTVYWGKGRPWTF